MATVTLYRVTTNEGRASICTRVDDNKYIPIGHRYPQIVGSVKDLEAEHFKIEPVEFCEVALAVELVKVLQEIFDMGYEDKPSVWHQARAALEHAKEMGVEL